jgi:hypothetical protein
LNTTAAISNGRKTGTHVEPNLSKLGVRKRIPSFFYERTISMSKKKKKVTLIVRQSYEGPKTAVEVLIPVLCEDIQRRMENGRTFDKTSDSK